MNQGRGPWRRPILAGAVLTIGVLLGCVWLVPAMLDWNRYRDGIAAFASQRLGRAVRIGGAVTCNSCRSPS